MLAQAEVLQKASSAQAPRGKLCSALATCRKTQLIAHNLPEHCVVGQQHGMHPFERAVNANVMQGGRRGTLAFTAASSVIPDKV